MAIQHRKNTIARTSAWDLTTTAEQLGFQPHVYSTARHLESSHQDHLLSAHAPQTRASASIITTPNESLSSQDNSSQQCPTKSISRSLRGLRRAQARRIKRQMRRRALNQRAADPNDFVGNQEEDSSKTVRVAAVNLDRHARVKSNQPPTEASLAAETLALDDRSSSTAGSGVVVPCVDPATAGLWLPQHPASVFALGGTKTGDAVAHEVSSMQSWRNKSHDREDNTPIDTNIHEGTHKEENTYEPHHHLGQSVGRREQEQLGLVHTLQYLIARLSA
jgi:hypothetical protein